MNVVNKSYIYTSSLKIDAACSETPYLAMNNGYIFKVCHSDFGLQYFLKDK